ncbi:MAG: beta-ketoacyl-[acyl-carrier-protein] synthase family protein [Desulfobacterales bacterium]|nr:beta-ketoacyl-[acyl-carrier-protein] synthase family protein [Desulfobacterales bacterium]MBF0395853.1 beta-ketoacyl-[acyl-carrier-protein] synthase family protein [Desulfobacterales bacterium]
MNLRIPITGIGSICSCGDNTWESISYLFSEKRNPMPPTRFKTNHKIAYPVFEINKDFSEFDGKIKISRTASLALNAARLAINNANLDCKLLKSLRVGVCIGTTVGVTMNNEEFYREYKIGSLPCINPIKSFLRSNPADYISHVYNLSGPVQTVVNACSSGTDAIGIAASWINSDICDIVIAGGADELCRVTYNGFISLLITDDSPSRPFDATRRGLNLGEAGAVLILESEKIANLRKQTPIAYFLGYGTSCDAYHLTAPKPDGSGLKQAIYRALKISNKNSSDIAFIHAHGTGTIDNDKVESQVLEEIFPDVPFLSTKGFTGHTLGAAGAISAVFTIAFLSLKKIPASIGFKTKDDNLKISPVAKETNILGTVAISQSLAFGGTNSAIVMEKV